MTQFARENGWLQLVARVAGSAMRRLRDATIARKLRTKNFRAGRSARLLGLAHMTVGKNFNGGDGLWLEAITSYGVQVFEPTLIIGDDVTVSDYVHIACAYRLSLGSGTLIGSRVIVSDHSHGVYHGDDQSDPRVPPRTRMLHSTGAIDIGRNVWLGDGVAVLAGATIGDGVVVGANSVVTGALPANTICVGAPAKPIREWDDVTRTWAPIADRMQ